MSLKRARYLLGQMSDSDMKRALRSTINERMSQEEKWGQQNHSPEKWLLILMEEVGEFSKEALDTPPHLGGKNPNLRAELVQVAAVALAMLECHDRNNWSNL